MTNAKLEIQISDEFNATFEAYLKEAARNVIQEVMSNPIERKAFLNKTETCSFIGISRASLEKLINKGLPIVMIESRVLISKESIKEFMKSIEQ